MFSRTYAGARPYARFGPAASRYLAKYGNVGVAQFVVIGSNVDFDDLLSPDGEREEDGEPPSRRDNTLMAAAVAAGTMPRPLALGQTCTVVIPAE